MQLYRNKAETKHKKAILLQENCGKERKEDFFTSVA